MKTLAVLFSPRAPQARELAFDIQRLMRKRGGTASVMEFERDGRPVADMKGVDLIVTLGGDGTLLRASHFAAELAIPILGVNLGKLGFLCDIGPEHAMEEIPSYLDGACQVEERLMLQASHLRRGRVISSTHALNDAVVGHAFISSIIRVNACIDGNRLTTFAADGVIVATPSGSTAYSFAAGGPIMHPADRQLLLTPISPHKPRFGSFVAPANAVITLEMESNAAAVLSVDGEAEMPLEDGDVVEVRESIYRTRLLRKDSERYFFQALRSTLKYGLEP